MSDVDVKRRKTVLAFLIVVSLFGIILSFSSVFFFSAFEDDFAFRNLVVGSAFIVICVLGILAALFPSSCLAVPQFSKSDSHDRITSNMRETTLRAHHPSCENYSRHILSIGKLRFCATCSGLVVGATVILFGAGLYFLGVLHTQAPSILVSIGAVGVTLGLLQSALPKFSNGSTRFFANILLVIGTFLMLVSIDEALKNTSVDLFLVALSVLWIITKMAFSQWDHQQTCSQCSKESCGRKSLR